MNRKIALLSAAAGALVMFAAVRSWSPAPLPVAAAVVAEPRAADTLRFTDPVPLIPLDATTSSGASRRNLFAYRELARPRQPVARIASLTPMVTLPVIEPPRVEPVTVQPALPTFPYTYLGRFGPHTNPIAVFKRDGEIVNARAGETIAGTYKVRRIAAEGVEIGFVGSDHVLTLTPSADV